MSRKFTSTIAGASILLTGVGILSRGLGLLREMVFAGSFGLGEEFDIYLVGAVIPMAIDVIILFLIQNYLIPQYNELLNKSPDQKESFIRTNFWVFSFLGFLLGLVLYFLSDIIISIYLAGSPKEKQEEAKLIFDIFLLILPFSAGGSVLISFLQNELDFMTPAIGRLSINAAVIVIVFFFSSSFGTLIIPIGFVAGMIIQFLILLLRTDIKLLTFSVKPVVKHHLKNSLSTNLIIIVIIESLSQLYAVSDRYFIKSVHEGGIAALSYSQTIFTLPIVTISVALSTAIFPRLSQNYSSGSMDELKKQFLSGIRINIFIFVPLMFIFFFNGGDIIKIIYQRGKFSPSDTMMTADSLRYFSISLILYSIYTILNKMIYSLRLVKSLLKITLAGIFLKIGLNYLLVGPLAQNGLALSTSVSYIFFFSAGFYVVAKAIKFRYQRQFIGDLILHFLSAAVSYYILFCVCGLDELKSSWLVLFVIGLFGAVYFLNLWIIKTDSVQPILKLNRNLKFFRK
jgi:putative peptidoglycan lipid II flippase